MRIVVSLLAVLAVTAACVGSSVSRDQPRPPSVDQDPRTRQNSIDENETKIFGGTPVSRGSFADVVAITRAGSRLPECTGTLIAADVVLTARHCVCDGIAGSVFFGENAHNASASTSFVKVHAAKEMVGDLDHIAGRCISPAMKKGRDLALLFLEHAVDVQPRKFAPNAVVDGARGYRAVGFGAVDSSGSVYPDEKREAPIVATSNNCSGKVNSRADQIVYGCIRNQEIVAGKLSALTDTCNGDSGGPLYVSSLGIGSAPSETDYAIAGVTSRATGNSVRNCGDGGVYERINAAARSWISASIESYRSSNR